MKTQDYFVKKDSFKKNYIMITAPGKYDATVRNSHEIFDKDLNIFKEITNFRAVAGHNVATIKDLYKGKEEINASDLNGLLLTYNAPRFQGRVVDKPANGEIVEITVDFVTNRKGEQVLGVTHMKLKPAVKAKAFSFDDEEEDEYTELTATPTTKEKVTI